MWLFNQKSNASRIALIYITLGALIIVWTCVWYIYLRNNEPLTSVPFYWCAGLLVSGVVLVGIGLGIGRIGREARHADLPAEINPPPAAAPLAQAPAAPMVAPIAPAATAPGMDVRGSVSAAPVGGAPTKVPVPR